MCVIFIDTALLEIKIGNLKNIYIIIYLKITLTNSF